MCATGHYGSSRKAGVELAESPASGASSDGDGFGRRL